MPAAKGNNYSPGRPKGAGNKDLQPIREAFTKLVEDNLENMNTWLEEVAKDNPVKALQIIEGLAEFSIPKLQRTELTGPAGGDITIKIERDNSKT